MNFIALEVCAIVLTLITSRVFASTPTLDYEGKFYEFLCYFVFAAVGLIAWIVWLIQYPLFTSVLCSFLPILGLALITGGLGANVLLYLKMWRHSRKNESSDHEEK